MVRTCCVPSCRSNYPSERSEGYYSCFSFPTNEKLKELWVKVIPRNFIPTKHSFVCVKHFDPDDIIKYDIHLQPDGTLKSLLMRSPKLKEGAIPKIFPNSSNEIKVQADQTEDKANCVEYGQPLENFSCKVEDIVVAEQYIDKNGIHDINKLYVSNEEVVHSYKTDQYQTYSANLSNAMKVEADQTEEKVEDIDVTAQNIEQNGIHEGKELTVNNEGFAEIHKQHKCTVCDYVATQKDNLKKHVESIHLNKKHQCSMCDYAATRKGNLKTHVEFVHLKKKRQCSTAKNLENPIRVQYLKTIRFSSLTLEEKQKIKSAGRPKPNLSITHVTKCKTRDYKRTFRMDTYERAEWLCGCEITNSLYCFPCLLFADDDQTEWTRHGVKDLIHLKEKIKKHQNCKTHLSAKLDFNLLGKQDIRQQLNSAYRLNIEKHNEQVKKNRYILSKIINCIKFCGAFELASNDHNEGNDSINPGIFKSLINFSAELDLALRDHLDQSTVFKGTSKDIQNELLDCMLSVCHAHIKKEIAASKFVSVISDETSDISNIFQMVIVFRYTLPDGTPVERFWGFLKPSDNHAVELAGCIENVLNSVLKKSDQLISQSYDGASVTSGVHGGVQKLIKDKFQYAYYVQCYAHQINSIMSQATGINANVRIFFADLSNITNFFSNSPQRISVLDEVVGRRALNAPATRLNFEIGTVNTVYENREALIECMEKIQTSSRQSDTVAKAGALLRLLNDPKFVFWLTVFHRLMPHIDIIYSQLQEKIADSVTIKKCISKLEKNVQKEKENIHTIRDSELDYIDVSRSRKRRRVDERTSFVSNTVQAKEVCDTVISEIKRRFSFTGHLEVANLFLVENFEVYSSNFPIQHLDSAVSAYPFLDRNKLKTELELIYRRTDFREVSGAIHLLKFLIENNLQEDFAETFHVLLAIVTMPMTTVETERCFSTLKRIKTFLRNTMGQDRLTALAMLSVEKQMIQDLPNFNELVIEEFISRKNERLEFQYKTCV